jgi:Chaperone of endosialidase
MKKLFPLILIGFVKVAFCQSTLILPSQTEIKSVQPYIDFRTSAGSKGFIGNVNGTDDIYLDVYPSNPSGRIRLRTQGNTRFMIDPAGKIRLGNSANANAELHFPNTIANRRILLWEDNNNDHQYYGFGINAGIQRYQISNTAAAHVFYAGTSASTSDELVRIQGNGAFSAGGANVTSGVYNIALGYDNTTSGGTTIAIGTINNSTRGITIGANCSVNGFYSTAIGQAINITDGADWAVAIGNKINVTSTGDGSLTLTDYNSLSTFTASASNRFSARFENGYYLYSNSSANVGAYLPAGGNSWLTISDSTKKEKIAEIEGETLLKRASKIKTSTWNYKSQDAKEFRHYGPMAQDFFAAFGKDKFGTIGNDTTIASADMAGVSFALIQALEKRTASLKTENEFLKTQITELKIYASKIDRLEAILNEKIINSLNSGK